MACAIRFVAIPDAQFGIAEPTWIKMTNAWQGWWLFAYDPDAYDGIGHADWTQNAEAAIRFDTEADARGFYTIASKTGTHPLAQVEVTINDPDRPVWDTLAAAPLARTED